MNQNIAKELIDRVDAIKEKLTDNEYMGIVNDLQKLFKQENDELYRFKIIYSSVEHHVNVEEPGPPNNFNISLKHTYVIAKFKKTSDSEYIDMINQVKNGLMVNIIDPGFIIDRSYLDPFLKIYENKTIHHITRTGEDYISDTSEISNANVMISAERFT